jgi:hypothetical protein
VNLGDSPVILSHIFEIVLSANNGFNSDARLFLEVSVDTELSTYFPLSLACNATFFLLSTFQYFLPSAPAFHFSSPLTFVLLENLSVPADSAVIACRFSGNVESLTNIGPYFDPGISHHAVFESITRCLFLFALILFSFYSAIGILCVGWERADRILFVIHAMILIEIVQMSVTKEVFEELNIDDWKIIHGVIQSLMFVGMRMLLMLLLWIIGRHLEMPRRLYFWIMFAMFGAFAVVRVVTVPLEEADVWETVSNGFEMVIMGWMMVLWVRLILEKIDEVSSVCRWVIIALTLMSGVAEWISGNQKISERDESLTFLLAELVDCFVALSLISFGMRSAPKEDHID